MKRVARYAFRIYASHLSFKRIYGYKLSHPTEHNSASFSCKRAGSHSHAYIYIFRSPTNTYRKFSAVNALYVDAQCAYQCGIESAINKRTCNGQIVQRQKSSCCTRELIKSADELIRWIFPIMPIINFAAFAQTEYNFSFNHLSRYMYTCTKIFLGARYIFGKLIVFSAAIRTEAIAGNLICRNITLHLTLTRFELTTTRTQVISRLNGKTNVILYIFKVSLTTGSPDHVVINILVLVNR